MSLVLAGSTSGSVTLQEPAVAGTTVLTLPATSGTVMVNGPAFSAYLGTAQTLSSSTTTKIALLTKEYDTNGCYNNTGSTVTLNGISVPSYSFAPNVAGYYQIQGGIAVASAATGMNVYIYKNGAIAKVVFNIPAANCSCGYGSAVVYLNGTSDSIALYATVIVGQNIDSASQNTYFQATMVRGA
jgi:hypothetical protein